MQNCISEHLSASILCYIVAYTVHFWQVINENIKNTMLQVKLNWCEKLFVYIAILWCLLVTDVAQQLRSITG